MAVIGTALHDATTNGGSSGYRSDPGGCDAGTSCRALVAAAAGLSSRPDAGYDKKNQAADVRGVLTQLGIDHAVVVGHDIGTVVAYAYARRYPDKTDRLVVMDAPVPGVPPWDHCRAQNDQRVRRERGSESGVSGLQRPTSALLARDRGRGASSFHQSLEGVQHPVPCRPRPSQRGKRCRQG